MRFIDFYSLRENTSPTITIPYINGNQYTCGVYAFHAGQKEVPAKDPVSIIKPEFVYPENELKEILNTFGCRILNVNYERYEWGSYHERQLYCQAYLEITEPDDIDESILMNTLLSKIEIDTYIFPLTNDSKLKKDTIPFTTFEDVLEKWWEMVSESKITQPTGSSEEFWNKKILTAQMLHNKTYEGD